jgi:hypothetical protein
MKQTVSSYLQDNSKGPKSDEDDTGLPENPIYSNYARHLWQTHTRLGGVRAPNRAHANTDGPRPPQGAAAAEAEPKLVAEENRQALAAA